MSGPFFDFYYPDKPYRVDAELSGPFSGWSIFGSETSSAVIAGSTSRYARIGGAQPPVEGEYVALSWPLIAGFTEDYTGFPEHLIPTSSLGIEYRSNSGSSTAPFYVRLLVDESPFLTIEVPHSSGSFATSEIVLDPLTMPSKSVVDAGRVRIQLLADQYQLDGITLAEFDISIVSFYREVPSTTPPLRQNQRDDARQNQRTSRQLTVRQRGYL